jgi:phosphoglycerate kinase
MKILTIDDFDIKGKTVLLRVDMNCPIDPVTEEISGIKRIEDVIETIKMLSNSKLVVVSHQGRVGSSDYIGMEQHTKILGKLLGKKINYIQDVMGSLAQSEIKKMKDGDIILLDNLRFCAEENYEFSPEDASNTVMVKRLAKLFDLCVLDSFASAHRAHPSLVGFSHIIPACAGKIVEYEIRKLEETLTVAKAPYVIVLGGSKIKDRLEAIKMLIKRGRADQILLTGLLANVFLRAQGRIRYSLGIKDEEEIVAKVHEVLREYPDVFFTPVDIAIDVEERRVECDVRQLSKGDKILDLGQKTINDYLKIIASAGTIFISGPAGFFENEKFSHGTKSLLEAVANSMATTIVSGGHLTSALKRYGLIEKITLVNTAGGALVLYLTGEKLPMIQSLESAAERYRSNAS